MKEYDKLSFLKEDRGKQRFPSVPQGRMKQKIYGECSRITP